MELIEKVKLSAFREWGAFYKIWIKMVDTINSLVSTVENLDTSVAGLEETSNKVTSISGTSTNTEYPSAKLLYDQLALKQNASTVKVYKAFIQQNGTLDPSAFPVQNGFSGTIVWTRQSAGTYVGTLTGAFTIAKTIVMFSNGVDAITSILRIDANTIGITTAAATTGVLTDELLYGNVLIEVYP